LVVIFDIMALVIGTRYRCCFYISAQFKPTCDNVLNLTFVFK